MPSGPGAARPGAPRLEAEISKAAWKQAGRRTTAGTPQNAEKDWPRKNNPEIRLDVFSGDAMIRKFNFMVLCVSLLLVSVSLMWFYFTALGY